FWLPAHGTAFRSGRADGDLRAGDSLARRRPAAHRGPARERDHTYRRRRVRLRESVLLRNIANVSLRRKAAKKPRGFFFAALRLGETLVFPTPIAKIGT